MNQMLPPPSPEMVSAYALLALIADPAAAKSKLDEFAAASTSAMQTLADAQAAQKAVGQDKDDAMRTRSAAEAARANAADMVAALDTRKADLDDREAKLAQRENDLAQRMSAADGAAKTSAAALADRESTVAARESATRRREEAVAAKALEVDALKADLDARMAVIQQLATGAM